MKRAFTKAPSYELPASAAERFWADIAACGIACFPTLGFSASPKLFSFRRPPGKVSVEAYTRDTTIYISLGYGHVIPFLFFRADECLLTTIADIVLARGGSLDTTDQWFQHYPESYSATDALAQ